VTQTRYTTGEVAALLGARLIGPPDLPLHTLAGIDQGGPGAITFIRSEEYAARWPASACTAALVSSSLADIKGHDPATRALIIVDSADRAMITLLDRISPPQHHTGPGVHPTAAVDPSATVDPAASVGHHAVVGPRTTVAAGAVIAAGVVLGADCAVGEGTELRPGVVFEDRCTIGARCRLFPNVTVGSDGFGYAPREDGNGVIKIPHAGSVEIHDDVEIGPGSTIDRGKFGATVIGQGSKIDNLCQIAHNVTIGRHCLFAAGTIIGGSATLGDRVRIGGNTVVADNISVGSDVSVGGASGVMRDIPDGESWLGYPAYPASATKRQWIAVSQLPDLIKSIKKIARNDQT